MKKTRILNPVFVAVALAAAAMPARAAVETFIADYGSSPAPGVVADNGQTTFPIALNLSKFDPSLGTLNDIILTLSSTDIVGSEVLNVTGSTQSYLGASVSGATVTVTGPDSLQTSSLPMSAGPFSGTVAPNSVVHAGSTTEVATAITVHVQPADFGNYTGSGVVSVGLSASSSSAQPSGSGSPSLFFGWYADGYGSVEIEYDYTAVPEPGTMCAGLAAISVCGIELARRLRQIRPRS
jgi:hypothetical protein